MAAVSIKNKKAGQSPADSVLPVQVSVKIVIIVIKVIIKHIVVSVVKHIARVVKAEERCAFVFGFSAAEKYIEE